VTWRWRVWAACFLGLMVGAWSHAGVGWWALPGFFVFAVCAVVEYRYERAGVGE
jgi:hypothetical protein